MSRVLKTKFPCRHCGDPAPVARLRDAPQAQCEPCMRRRGALMMIAYADESAERERAKVDGKAETWLAAADGVLKSAERWVTGAQRCVEVVPHVRALERRTWIEVGARSRVRAAMRLLEDLEQRLLVLAAEELPQGLEVIASASDDIQPAPERTPPVLRLVRRDSEDRR
jgi:hypothetical protein